MIDIGHLTKTYVTRDGVIAALDDVSLRVETGEFVAICGSSGSGKTTLLNLIGGLDRPDKGTILLDGRDIASCRSAESALLRRRIIGVVYQFFNLIPELTVAENVTLPRELDGEEPDRERLGEILALVGLEDRANAYPDTLSGGQAQRAAIARAIYMKPTLLLADEPTGNLDRENTRQVLALMRRMNRELGMTVLLVTHSDEAAETADRVITLKNGRIAEEERL